MRLCGLVRGSVIRNRVREVFKSHFYESHCALGRFGCVSALYGSGLAHVLRSKVCVQLSRARIGKRLTLSWSSVSMIVHLPQYGSPLIRMRDAWSNSVVRASGVSQKSGAMLVPFLLSGCHPSLPRRKGFVLL